MKEQNNKAEKNSDSMTPEPAFETITYFCKKKRVQKDEFVQNLPIELVEYRLPNEEQACSCCGGSLHEMRVDNVRNNTIYNFLSSNFKKINKIYI
ncbi:hypothetical protein ACQVUB_26030 [Bacillus mycoides]|uniref:hypothetical protein n=1 Tax=Bacillus mycoides TaxID=1405 RepID=UPI003D657049